MSEKAVGMSCTSINHCENSNLQIDYSGIKHDCIANFERWCLKNDVLWARLFDEKTGELVASFNIKEGLQQ